MGKYIEYLYFNKQPGERYYLSADYANSAMMSTIASSYSFDKPIELWDDFIQITIDHPFKYSSQPVTSLSTTAVRLLDDAETVTGNFNVYDAAYNVISTSEYKIHSMPSYEFNHQYNSHFTESIYGQFRQTASVSEREAEQRWVIPVKFKVASYYRTMNYWYLDIEYDDRPNLWGEGVEPITILNPGEFGIETNYYRIWGTTVPAVLFREAGIYNIPVYNANNTAYRLNTEIFATLGNVGHVSDVQNNDFVKCMNGLLNISNCTIVSATVKDNSYDAQTRIASGSVPAGGQISVKPYTVLSANVTDTVKSIGTLHDTNVNALRYAFYDANRNYMALTADNNKIFDEYTYYCEMPVSAYANSSQATAAIQAVINNYNYIPAEQADIIYSYEVGHGTLNSTDMVFSFSDEILHESTYQKTTVYTADHGIRIPILPYRHLNSETHHDDVYTTALVTANRHFKELYTVITKPVIVSADVKQISTTSYTYSFGELYVVNSAFTAHDTKNNQTIYKSDVFSMLHYSSPEIAPVEQCNATYAGYDTLCSMYYTPCDTVFRSVRLPATTDRDDRNKGLIPIATSQSTTTTTHFTDLPTRDIYFCITMSK